MSCCAYDCKQKLISMLMDKYTMTGKTLQDTKTKLIKIILGEKKSEVDYFSVCLNFLLKSDDVDCKEYASQEKRKPYKYLKEHDSYTGKILFLQELLSSLPITMSAQYSCLLSHKGFQELLIKLALNGHLSLRKLPFEILDQCIKIAMCDDPPKNIISKERIRLIQICFNIVKISLEQLDCYLHFYGLILIDNIFQNILQLPTFDDEATMKPSDKNVTDIIDIEACQFDKYQDLTITDSNYLHMRLLIVLKLWPLLLNMLNSNWSNIRSIAYGLLCSMLKITLSSYKHAYQNKLKALLLPLLNSLLASKESESKAGGLNILGSFCGLSYDLNTAKTKIKDNIEFFQKNSTHISLPIWQAVFEMQDDWDSTIKEASTVLIQLCAPKEPIKHFIMVNNESSFLKTKTYLNKIGSFHKISQHQAQANSFISDDLHEDTYDISDTLSKNKEYNNFLTKDLNSESSNEEPSKENEDFFYLGKLTEEQIKEIVSIFRCDYKPPKSLWIDKENLIMDEFVVAKETERNEKAVMDMYEEKLVTENKVPQKQNPVVELVADDSGKKEKPRSYEGKKTDSLDAEPYKFLNNEEDISNEDLGIIDADEDELYMNFDDAPVLKNAYKKHKGNSKKLELPQVTPSAVIRPENGNRPCTPPLKISEEPKDTEIMFDAIKESNKIMQANVTRLKQDLELPQKPTSILSPPSVQINLTKIEPSEPKQPIIEESKDDSLVAINSNDCLNVKNGKKKLNKSFEQPFGTNASRIKKQEVPKGSSSPHLMTYNNDDINSLLQNLEKGKLSTIPRTPNYNSEHNYFEENRIKPAKQVKAQRSSTSQSHSYSKTKSKSKEKARIQSDILSQTSPSISVSLKKMKGNKSFTIESQSDRGQLKEEDKVKIIKNIYAVKKKEHMNIEGKRSPPPIQRYSAMESKQFIKKECKNASFVEGNGNQSK